jgi:hypothetical protein
MENPDAENQLENKTPPKSLREREKEFSEAVERVYHKYGNNLSAFLRDIQKDKELAKKG